MGWYYGAGAGTPLLGVDLNKSFCALAAEGKSPYLKISGGINLNTIFGDPNRQPYPDLTLGLATPLRKFSIPLNGGVCSALPSLGFSGGGYSGAPEWKDNVGFLPQPAGSDNFPTTGAEGLYFDLIIGGVDATTLDWPGYPVASPVVPALTDKGVTVTIINVTATKVRVKLTGPKASSTAVGGTAPAFGGSTTNPANFVIQGLQGTIPIINYSFGIRKWYVNRGTIIRPATYTAAGGGDNQSTWCNSLAGVNYTLSGVRDLSNAYSLPPASFPLNSNNANAYQRRIGGGLFTEWGFMANYIGAGFNGSFVPYWTPEIMGGIYNYEVYMTNGFIVGNNPVVSRSAICVSRP